MQHHTIFLTAEPYKKLFLISALVMFMIMLLVCDDYGISWDDSIQKFYGEQVLNYYLTLGKDTSALYSQKFHLQFYGGIFDVTTVAIHKAVNALVPIDEYTLRHLFTALLGFIAVVFTGLTAKELSCWRSGVIALYCIFLTPVFFGHSMYNPKDIPFAASYILGVYFITKLVKDLPAIRVKTSIFVCLSIALAINIRIGGLLLIFYMIVFSGMKMILLLIKERPLTQEKSRVWGKSIVSLMFLIIASYFLGLLFWPFGLSDPLRNPFIALRQMSNYDLHIVYELFDGKWVLSSAFPWYYIPQWILITTPLFMTFGFISIPILFIKKMKQSSFSQFPYILFVFFTALFPVMYVIIRKSNLYDSWRHLLFVYPPLVVIVSLTWNNILLLVNTRLYRMVSVGILLLFFLEPAVWMIRNHPHQTYYFSPLIGGVNGAFKKYEIDYWGISLRPAVEWIAAQKLPSEDTPIIRIRNPYGGRPSSEHFIDKYNHLVYVETPEESPDWDYALILPAMAKFQPELLTQWPPQGTVHEIKADDTPLVAIVKNYRTVSYMQSRVQRAIQEAAKNKSPENYLNLSVRYYEAGQYEKCIEAAQDALKLKPDFASAYNNICSAYNEMKMWDKAIEACHQALTIEPEFELAKNNLDLAFKKHLMQRK